MDEPTPGETDPPSWPETVAPALPETVESTGLDLSMTFVVARGRGADRACVAPSGCERAGASFAAAGPLQGRYELGRELGRGGMGVVYLGRDVRLDRPVAIKAILSDEGGGYADREREAFAEEARLGANLTHPAIATVYDYGFHEGRPFAVFEFIPGSTLREVLARRGSLPLDEARLIVGALAQALDFAHERHVVHRDLKPENIRATEQGQFKVLDLGLAKDFHRHEDWTFCGTPAYASPEQATARPCDGRTDQYALAVIAFEMIAGRRPFEDRSWRVLLDRHAHQEPPRLGSLRPDVPDSVAEALDRALSKDPNRRFGTCVEFAVAMGCQLLAAPAPPSEVLLEATCKKMAGRWRSFTEPMSFSITQPRVHLALAPDALWATYRGMLMRWPIGAIAGVDRRGRWLRIRLSVPKGRSTQKFRLGRRKECRAWAERLGGLVGSAKPPGGDDPPGPAAAVVGEPRPDPIVLLPARPSTRFQLLGPVEVKAARRKLARPALAIRGSMMGADAIVDLREERLAGAYRTEFRASGTAVRAVDREGRLELKARWFDAQARSLRLGLISIATLGLLGSMHAPLTLWLAKAPASYIAASLVSLLGSAWLFGLSVAFGLLRWPQLARAVAFSFLGEAAALILAIVGALAGGLSTGSLMAGSLILLILIVNSAFSFSIFAFYFYVGRRALAIDRDYRLIVADDEGEVDPTRRAAGRAAMAITYVCAAWLIGYQTWSSYEFCRSLPGRIAALRADIERDMARGRGPGAR